MVDEVSLQKAIDELEKLASDIETRGKKLLTEAPKASTQKHTSTNIGRSYQKD